MTDHALERIAERCPGVPPMMVLDQIIDDLNAGDMVSIAQQINGTHITTMVLETGQRIYPVVAQNGAICTIMLEGFTVSATHGFVRLVGGKAEVIG